MEESWRKAPGGGASARPSQQPKTTKEEQQKRRGRHHMLDRVKLASFAAAAAAGLCLAASPVLAQIPGQTKDELKCESSTGKALTKFVSSKSKCVSKCFVAARKTSGPFTGCFATPGQPYPDPTTNTCITDPLKGAETKAKASIVKACMDADGKDKCPECYAVSTCNTGEPNVHNTEILIDIQGPAVYCQENSGTPPTKEETKCEDGNVKALVKLVGALAKCYDKCNQNIAKAKIPAGSCVPGDGMPNPTDIPTRECLGKATGKSIGSINKACFIAPAVAPTCYDGSGLRPNTGAGWTALIKGVVDGQTPGIACGSPSGAFLN